MEIVVARTLKQRTRGLALKRRPPDGWALAFLRCRSVHTFGMRFPIDVVFLDARGEVVRVVRSLAPRRLASCGAATAVIETRAGQGEIIVAMAEQRSSKLVAALDPRQPIYRDSYNEYFVFLRSRSTSR